MVRPGAWRAWASRHAASGTADAAPVRTTSPSFRSREIAMLIRSRAVSPIPDLRHASSGNGDRNDIFAFILAYTFFLTVSRPPAGGVRRDPAKADALVPADPVRVAQLDEPLQVE